MSCDTVLRTFVTHLPKGTGPVSDDCGGTVRRLADHARATWPDLDVPDETFVAYLAERVRPDADVAAQLETMHVADLYLACACVQRVPGALEHFERHLAGTIEAFIRTVHGATDVADEIRQALRHKLFVDGDAGAPKIARYAGRGKLSSWIGVTVQRIALDTVRTDGTRTVADADALGESMPAGTNPELDYLKARYRDAFRAAFQMAVAELTQRERIILRHHYVNGLSQDRIARMYGINQATVSRWIANARESIRRSAERELRRRLDVDASEIQSIAALIKSQFDMSLARCLGNDAAPPA